MLGHVVSYPCKHGKAVSGDHIETGKLEHQYPQAIRPGTWAQLPTASMLHAKLFHEYSPLRKPRNLNRTNSQSDHGVLSQKALPL